MRYAQYNPGNKLHLVYEPGEGHDDQHLVRAGHLSTPLCGQRGGNYRMTINVPLRHACQKCIRLLDKRKG